jgi:SnoaL-like domain
VNAVERLWVALRNHDWKGVAAQVHPSVVVEYPATGERFEGANEFVLSHRLRPEELSVNHVEFITGDQQVAVYAVVTTPTGTDHVMAFYRLHETRIAHIVELWVTAGTMQPPRWRG